MELKEKIKVMQHFEDGREIEFSDDNFKTTLGEANKKDDNDLGWNWEDFNYRIKEQKQKVIMHKWLVRDAKGDFITFESSNKHIQLEKVKLLYTYEVEL